MFLALLFVKPVWLMRSVTNYSSNREVALLRHSTNLFQQVEVRQHSCSNLLFFFNTFVGITRFLFCTLPFRALGDFSDFKNSACASSYASQYDNLRKVPQISLKFYLEVLTQIAAMQPCSSFNRRVMVFAEIGCSLSSCTRTLCRDPNKISTLLCKLKTLRHLFS